MGGTRPQTIVTDIDSGLREAITIELPNTKHVVSVWYIQSKISSWFSLVLGSQYAEFKMGFDMLCHLENIEDFDHQWSHLVARFGLGSDKHVAMLFSYRASWPFSYIRGYFLARTMTPKYSKSVDSFLKNILSPQSSLQFFFDQVYSYSTLFSMSKLPMCPLNYGQSSKMPSDLKIALIKPLNYPAFHFAPFVRFGR